MTPSTSKIAEGIITHLSNFQSKEGYLTDPHTKQPIPNSYGSAFYSLTCAKIYIQTKETKWKEKSISALRAELNWAKNAANHQGIYRWEFKNYALLQLYTIFHTELPPTEKTQLQKYIKTYQNICSYQTNYTTMRALNSQIRYQLFHKSKDKIRAKLELTIVNSRQDQDGFFSDDAHHHSFQYHAYILTLLYQYYELTRDQNIKQRFLNGVNFLLPFIDQDGDFNYFGRGQKQIFGYVSYIYALHAAAHITRNSYYQDKANKILAFIEPYLKDHRIICTPTQNIQQNHISNTIQNSIQNTIGYYSYNNISDYLSFAAYYLLKSSEFPSISEKNSKTTSSIPVFNENQPFIKYYPTPNLLLIREKEFLCVLGGTPGNNAELPLIIHTHPTIFATSGGPPNDPQNNLHYSTIFTGVHVKNGALTLKKHHNTLTFLHVTTQNIIKYQLLFSNKVTLNITIEPKRSNTIIPFHAAAISNSLFMCTIPLEKTATTSTLSGPMNMYESKEKYLDKQLKFQVSFGNINGTYTLPPIRRQPKLKPLFDNILKYPYFTIIIGLKTIKNPKHILTMMKYYQERNKYYHQSS